MFHDKYSKKELNELYPLSRQRISALRDDFSFDRCESRKRLIRNWDQLLASPTRDYLLSSNGDRGPISSLKGKVIGLYFCENVPCPPRMGVIKEAYREAKLRGYDFEIVQINFHYMFFYARETDAVFSKQQHCQNIDWLTLPFKDQCRRKLQRIFKCTFEDDTTLWRGDCLVIVVPRESDEVVFELRYSKTTSSLSRGTDVQYIEAAAFGTDGQLIAKKYLVLAILRTGTNGASIPILYTGFEMDNPRGMSINLRFRSVWR